MDIEKRIKELEEERDRLLKEPEVILGYDKRGWPQTNHKSIRSKYNAKITNLRKYGVENVMNLESTKTKQLKGIEKSWTDERRKVTSDRWKSILTPDIIAKRTETRLKNRVYKEKSTPKTREEIGKTKAYNTYTKYKNEFKDNLISTFSEYYNRKNQQDIAFKCSICGNSFKTSVYSYRDGLTRCKNCRHEYKSNAIKSSTKYQEGLKRRDKDRRSVSINYIKEIWKDELEILEDLRESVNPESKVKYRCLRCGHVGKQEIQYLVKGLLEGSGCSNMCHRDYKGSSYELELDSFFKELGFQEDVDYIRHDRSILKSKDGNALELDFYFPKYNLAIEFNGLYHHSYNYKIKLGLKKSDIKNYHFYKTYECEKLGIHLIHIWQHEWINYKDRIKSIIKGELGLTENRIYARLCEVREVPIDEYKEFITRLSVLRYRYAKHRFGLYYNNKLVMCMGIGWCQSGKGTVVKDKLEIVRSQTELDTIVVGGSSKLLKHIKPILNDLYPDIHELVYYIDYDKHLGKSASSTNAIFDGYSGPGSQNYCAKTIDLINKDGKKRHLEFGKIYSRIPAFHKEILKAIDNDEVYALYTSGTKRFHYNI